MQRKHRQPQSLSFRGWYGDGNEVVLHARLEVQMANGTWQVTGPNLIMSVPAVRLLDESVVNAAHWAQHDLEQAQRLLQQATDSALQEPLF